MDILTKLREVLGRPAVAGLLGFFVGLIFGLPILGWGLFPVEWVDATPNHLREDLKKDYLRMVVDNYAVNHDKTAARQRWDILGESAPVLFKTLQNENKVRPENMMLFSMEVVQAPATILTPAAGGITPAAGTPVTGAMPGTPVSPEMGGAQITPTPAAGGASGLGIFGSLLYIGVVVLCLVIFIILAVLAYLLLIKKRKPGIGVPRPAARPAQQPAQVQPGGQKVEAAAVSPGDGQPIPVAQFMTTYTLGDDLYDDSFSIDAPSGEFLGECGVGISDTIGTGDPKKVSAFEVWLFDKNDVQTVTKVLMSENSFNDPAARQKLEAKGELLLVEAGKQVMLETATLQMEARVVDSNYGQSALPANSFLDRITLELTVWTKTAS